MLKKEEYDLEPVAYCKHCYSLKIKYEDAIDGDCCMNCGSTDIGTTDINTWETLYRNRYGHPYTVKSDNPKDSIYFKMSLDKLKTLVYNDQDLHYILHKLYRGFPLGLSRADSVILLFDKLSKDNRIDDLRYLYYMKSRHQVRL